MLSEHGLITSDYTPFRCLFSRYQDMLYALRHFSEGIAYNNLVDICKMNNETISDFVKGEVGHIENKWGNCRITEKGIEYNDYWFAIQDRFDIRDIVPTVFKIHDVPYNDAAIRRLMDNISNGNSQNNSCYKLPSRKRRRDSITRYLDGLRYLNKHKDGVKIYDMMYRTSFGPYYLKFIDSAISKGHINFDEQKKSQKGKPLIIPTTEGLTLLKAVDWLVTKVDLGDYVPSQVG